LNYKGSKNIVFLALAVVIIGGAFLFSEYRNGYAASEINAQEAASQTIITPQVATSAIQSITYSDDWKKTLLLAGTSSWMDLPSNTGSYFSPGQSVTGATDLFGKQLFAQYVAAKQAGEDTSATDTQQYIVGQVLADGTVLPSPPTYDKSNFSITSDNSNAALAKYGNDLASLLNTEASKHQTSELAIAQDSLDSNDPSILKQLDPIIANDQILLKALLAEKVPSALADFHVEILNAVSEIIFADQGLTKTYSDGIVSLQGLGTYQKGIGDLTTALENLVRYFALVKVVFQPTDPGFVFMTQSK
jgi:hypothetical protein